MDKADDSHQDLQNKHRTLNKIYINAIDSAKQTHGSHLIGRTIDSTEQPLDYDMCVLIQPLDLL